MGDHYLPQYYLKGFTEKSDSKFIWVYERGGTKELRTQINNIANENKLYSREIEKLLANEIEAPANYVINKLRKLLPITQQEKLILAKYLIVMIKRVPSGKNRFLKILPDMVVQVFDGFDEQLITMMNNNPDSSRKISRIRNKLAKIKDDPQKREEMFWIAWLTNIPAERSPRSLDAFMRMKWCFLISEKEDFITSDNPIALSREMGIVDEKSDVSFPISKNLTLCCTWNHNLVDLTYFRAGTSNIREINRRTVKNALKYVFSNNPFDWIPDLLKKTNIRTRRIIINL